MVYIMRTTTYYRVRSIVRLSFWGTIALGSLWLTISSLKTIDDYTCEPIEVIVQPSDTLWGIVEKHCYGAIGVAVDDLTKSRNTHIVFVGQTIKLTSRN